MATSDNKFLNLSLIVLCLFVRCSSDDISRAFWSEEAARLLSADDVKTWQFASRTEDGTEVNDACRVDNTLTFVKNATADSLYILGMNSGCLIGAAADTIFKAKYALDVNVDNAFLNSITLSEERHAEIGTFEVTELTSKRLKIVFTANGQQIEELYTH